MPLRRPRAQIDALPAAVFEAAPTGLAETRRPVGRPYGQASGCGRLSMSSAPVQFRTAALTAQPRASVLHLPSRVARRPGVLRPASGLPTLTPYDSSLAAGKRAAGFSLNSRKDGLKADAPQPLAPERNFQLPIANCPLGNADSSQHRQYNPGAPGHSGKPVRASRWPVTPGFRTWRQPIRLRQGYGGRNGQLTIGNWQSSMFSGRSWAGRP
jgi:hypothetical protein